MSESLSFQNGLSSCNGMLHIKLTENSSQVSLQFLGRTINFSYEWLQYECLL